MKFVISNPKSSAQPASDKLAAFARLMARQAARKLVAGDSPDAETTPQPGSKT